MEESYRTYYSASLWIKALIKTIIAVVVSGIITVLVVAIPVVNVILGCVTGIFGIVLVIQIVFFTLMHFIRKNAFIVREGIIIGKEISNGKLLRWKDISHIKYEKEIDAVVIKAKNPVGKDPTKTKDYLIFFIRNSKEFIDKAYEYLPIYHERLSDSE